MCNIVFVDDEPSILEGLGIFLNWEELGFNIVGSASDGLEALSLIENIKPQLVICDIRMPFMDGLSIMEKTKVTSPLTQFIVLSSYQDFSYAQKAMHLGALCYLTKPLDTQELFQAVTKAKVTITDLTNQQIEDQSFILYTANQVYNDILNGINNPKLTTKAKLLFNLKDNCEVQLLWFTINIKDNNLESDPKIISHLMELTGLKNENCIFYYGFGHYIMVLQNSLETINLTTHNIIERVLISAVHSGETINALRACGKQLDILRAYSILHPTKQIINYSLINNWQPKDIIPQVPFKELISAIKGTDENKVHNAIKHIFKTLHESKISWNIYTLCLYRLADLVGKTAYAYGIAVNSEITQFIASIENTINIENTALQMCLSIFQKQNQHNNKPITQLENEIITYIKDNFTTNLSIQKIADIFSLTPAIISKIIKKQTNHKFNEYLNILRIDHAKKLIASSHMKITTVSEACGYSDYAYFTGKFKELTAITPSEYKKRFQ